ncbi:MAG TPA: hypothetical protein DEF88_11685, partial [Porphyromonadaceae bacterium]|nr:hypothetical protein [Porphyromonadaceae bacterium]
YEKNWIDVVQWHLEDIIRDPDILPKEALEIKRWIDRSNQERTDLVEKIDNYFLHHFQLIVPANDAVINTESPAWAIDRLSILAIKIYHMREEVNRMDTDQQHLISCRQKLNVLMEQRVDLSAAIDRLLDDIAQGRKYMKVYRQMKMYNDPSLNPVLYGKNKNNIRTGFTCSYMSRILIIRLSALGDVAMTVPVVHSFAKQYPQHQISVLSRTSFAPIFRYMPANVRFIGVDLKKQYKGLKGLNRLYKTLKAEQFDMIADFHSVLRTYYLDFRFRWSGIRTVRMHKGYREKEKLTRKKNKIYIPLKSTFTRYKEVLETLGYSFEYSFSSIFEDNQPPLPPIPEIAEGKTKRWIGVAPFARHKGKIYPLELQEKVLAHLARQDDTKVFLFGGGAEEKKTVEQWVRKYPALVSVVGKLTMDEELALMSYLDVMISMDSGNMHLASLVGTRVISLWGATHPYAGFMGWKQSMDDALQIDLYCRPCSVSGKKACYRGDYACMYGLPYEKVIAKIEE